ncbi:hypothetical protein [Roseovarius pacificus]|uniref:hypothetical protein n=1 Tax=Roseovarius pacificus TaxID=337701 RepID=UPI00403A0EEB
MAITFPLDMPCTVGFSGVRLRAVNAAASDKSPFTFRQQVVEWPGQQWEADISLPSYWDADAMRPWTAFLVSLKGPVGTFLLGSRQWRSPRGTVSACTLSGSAGDETATVTMTGTLLAGDYIQLGTGSAARLHMVTKDQDGSGSLEVWPALRDSYTDATVTFTDPKGVFRLARNLSEWEIDSAGVYGLSFAAVEAIS